MIKVDDTLNDGQSQSVGITFFVVGLVETGEKAGLIQSVSIRAVGEADPG